MTMLNTFASLQHINQFNFQAAWDVLSENLKLYPECYETMEDFLNYAPEICNQFPDDERNLTDDDCKSIASKVWYYKHE